MHSRFLVTLFLLSSAFSQLIFPKELNILVSIKSKIKLGLDAIANTEGLVAAHSLSKPSKLNSFVIKWPEKN